jgi:hypothetical protein
VKYDRTDSFKSDYKKLSAAERELFRAAVRDINEVVRQYAGQGMPAWPARLRIKRVQGATGIFEMTWSFSGPDGRATFEILSPDGEPVMLWRRIGGHSIFRKP